jgi:hypothetical protein
MTSNFLRSVLAAGLSLNLASGLALHLAVGLILNLAAGQLSAAAAVPAIGTVVTYGAFRLNHATVRSNATLFEGAMVETDAAPARVELASGARLELESESTGRFLRGHLVLERGAARIDRFAGSGARLASGFLVEARSLTVQPNASASTGRIVLNGAGRVEVAAVTGSFRVLNTQGTLVAKITSGRALALEVQSTPGPARVTGRLVRRDGHYLLTDETTNITMEVAGSVLTEANLTRALGQRVALTGSAHSAATPGNGAAQVIEVAQVTPAPPAPGSAPAGSAPTGAGGAGGTAPAGTGGAGGAGGAAGGGFGDHDCDHRRGCGRGSGGGVGGDRQSGRKRAGSGEPLNCER